MSEITGTHFLDFIHDAGFQHQLSVILENNAIHTQETIFGALQNRIN